MRTGNAVPFIGSRALTGTVNTVLLEKTDAMGVSVAQGFYFARPACVAVTEAQLELSGGRAQPEELAALLHAAPVGAPDGA